MTPGPDDHEPYIRRALELAREAADRGDDPFGSLLVRDGEVVMEERNAVVSADDIRRHPELRLAERAAREFDPAGRAATTMYTSTEPCPMCAAGIYYAGLGGVVYSASAADVAELAGADLVVPCRELFDRGTRDVAVHGPVCNDSGRRIHEECWPRD